ncbi:MAG: ABC transporter permease [Candidatus Bathyarchaeota archaeon]|nr:ABC transporter permease [Candidatus Bathyarchaeota archaeon]
MERWGFPLKDLSRRRFQTVLTVVSLATCVSVTVFLLLFGENLGVEVTSFATEGLTVGFSGVFSRFILMIVLFNSVTGFLVAYFLITVTTSERIRDIGIMKAVGCLTDVVFNYFATELLVIVLSGCLLGTVGGILMSYVSVGLMNLLGFSISAKPLNPMLVVLVFFAFFFIFYIVGLRRVVKASGIEPVRALSPLTVWKTAQRSTFGFPVSLGKRFVVSMASRVLGRRRSATIQYIACLSLVVALTTLAVVGGIVADETMQSYVERAVGKDAMLIAEPEMAEHYESLLLKFLGASQAKEISYLDQRYAVSDSVVSRISDIDGIVKVEPCLVLEATVQEYPHIRPDPEEPSQYVVIGDHRSGSALIVGVHAENLVNNWLILGGNLAETDPDSALVGDSLASSLFLNPWLQTFKVLKSEFNIAGVCLDPLNNGMVFYVSFDRLSAIAGHDGYNLLLLQVDPSHSPGGSGVLDQIEAIASESGLTVLDLSEVLGKLKASVSYIWTLMLSLSLFSFLNAILSLTGYLTLSMSGQQRDFGIMRALGAKPGTVIKLVLFETLLLVLAAGSIGLPVGIAIVLWFFIPEPVVSLTAILSIILLLSALAGALCLSSVFPARKIAKTPMTKAMSQA